MAKAEIVLGESGGSISSYNVNVGVGATLTAEVGKKYVILLWSSNNTASSYTKYDSTTFTNATYRKLSNFWNSNDYAVGTFFEVTATGTSVTITPPSNGVATCIYAE